ncbi:hypothetical protein M011DRAFT_230679 [Sporormia fimetaria CBS 119925]|uniref:Uncharacterized protein n=1 Tax=Sporormia fimetaria CBS 119925 TaxID=1340428 RepID=A0A6A6VK64_9PLEO|nr:hypothetical protein M011DRAFT_230679 [Sporormia fimetaria CBS 119925]
MGLDLKTAGRDSHPFTGSQSILALVYRAKYQWTLFSERSKATTHHAPCVEHTYMYEFLIALNPVATWQDSHQPPQQASALETHLSSHGGPKRRHLRHVIAHSYPSTPLTQAPYIRPNPRQRSPPPPPRQQPSLHLAHPEHHPLRPYIRHQPPPLHPLHLHPTTTPPPLHPRLLKRLYLAPPSTRNLRRSGLGALRVYSAYRVSRARRVDRAVCTHACALRHTCDVD